MMPSYWMKAGVLKTLHIQQYKHYTYTVFTYYITQQYTYRADDAVVLDEGGGVELVRQTRGSQHLT